LLPLSAPRLCGWKNASLRTPLKIFSVFFLKKALRKLDSPVWERYTFLKFIIFSSSYLEEKNTMWKMCIAAVALSLLASNTALAAELKIGVVDMREIATSSEPAKKAKTTMESKFGAERDKLEKQGKDLQKQADALKSPAANQTREALEQKRAEFIRKKQDLDQKGREFGAKVEKEQAQLQNEILEVVLKAAKDFAAKKGITYLVDVNSGILYSDPSLDVTKEFLEEVNRQWKDNPPASGGKKK
jgi:outer membrane protein